MARMAPRWDSGLVGLWRRNTIPLTGVTALAAKINPSLDRTEPMEAAVACQSRFERIYF